MKKTKIVCTLGPASKDKETMRQMLLAGMNVARLNFSHGTHEGHKELITKFREARDSLNIPAAILLDTKGPEIRLGSFENGTVILKDGSDFTLTTKNIIGNERKAYIDYPELPKKVSPGDIILIADGSVKLNTISCTDTEIHCKVIHGGTIGNRKSINVPKISLDMVYISEQDKADLLFGIENDVDFVAASFVRSKEDVLTLRKFLDYHGGRKIKIISKIENLEGVDNFDEILKESDGIMIARGDMGVEIEYERLPGIQKKFIKSCYQAGKMVITATQMLESMINHHQPTRAEITDVANAVFDGTSAVMLSGESAMGKYPIGAVRAMAKIAAHAEKDAFNMGAYEDIKHEMDETDITNAICDATCTTARDINARAIIAVTKYGNTARSMSKFRPFEPVVAATPDLKTFHQLALSWGVYPVMAKYQKSSDDLFLHAIDCAKQIDMVSDGDRVVITAGIPLDTSGNTNILKVEVVGNH